MAKRAINLDEARAIIKLNGQARVYATFLDGVYKGQIDRVASVTKLDELTSVYRVELWTNSTTLADLISDGRIQIVTTN